jgi:predicted phosphodiesterase
MDATARATVKAAIQATGISLQEALATFSEYDHWDVRKVHAEVKREEAEARMAAAATSPVLAPTFSKKGLEAMQAGWLRPQALTFATAPVAAPLFESDGKVTLVCSDIHAPDTDPDAMDVLYQIGQAIGVERIIVNGDWFDITSLSRFTPGAEQHLRFIDERAAYLRDFGGPVVMRQQFPDAVIDFVPGNHDVRPINWVNANAMPLQGMFSLAQWLGIDDPKLAINLVESGRVLLAGGKLVVKHGTKVSQFAGQSVKKEMDQMGESVIMGHVHRRALIEVTKANRELVGVELGCLCTLTPHYGNREDVVNWQQGFLLVTEYPDGDYALEQVKITNGKAHFRGRRFVSRFQAAPTEVAA